MCNVPPFEIIATGSSGNAAVINDCILIDCGVPFKALQRYYTRLRLVLLTHIHSDHFERKTIRRLASERPTLRFGCGPWLVKDVADCGVLTSNIDVMRYGETYNYGICRVEPVPLVHNVPNYGYKVFFPNAKIMYATDTNNLNGIEAPDFDLYLIEANYVDEEIMEKIRQKEAIGEYAYERQVLKNHLSKKKCDDFIYRNAGRNSRYVYMHCHREET